MEGSRWRSLSLSSMGNASVYMVRFVTACNAQLYRELIGALDPAVDEYWVERKKIAVDSCAR